MAKYSVQLTEEERAQLRALVSSGSKKARDIKRAQILLAADEGLADEVIARALSSSTSTVYRTKKQFVEHGTEVAIHDLPRPGASRKLTGKEEALLIATVCTDPPAGRARWTLELLAGAFVQLTGESISRETVRRRLHDNVIKPWQQSMWCIAAIDAEYVMRMEEVIDLYTSAPAADEPVVCFDESPVQLIGEMRLPRRIKPGRPARHDYEYKRNGTANLFVMVDAHAPWRHVDVTDQHTAVDFARCLQRLVDIHYPTARVVHLVLDNYGTHTKSALYKVFPPGEASRIAKRLHLHFVPKHASWLNMAELEIGLIKRQCLDRRIPDKAKLTSEIAAWEAARNQAGARVRWMFTLDKAREKMGRSYPTLIEQVDTKLPA
jgi:transposase